MIKQMDEIAESKSEKLEKLVNSIDKFLEDFIMAKDLSHSLMLDDFATGKHEFKVMNILFNQPESSVGIIAAKIRLDISTVTAILNNMFEKGFIDRYRANKDRRNVLVRLSEKGNDTFRKNKIIEQNINQSLLSVFNPGEKELFSTLLEKFFSNNTIHNLKDKKDDKPKN